MYECMYIIPNHSSIMAETAVAITTVLLIGLLLSGHSSARELRPSDHGLTFQTLSPTSSKSSPEMRSFFNSENSSPMTSTSSSSSSSSSDVALPRAMNSGESAAPPSWLNATAAGAKRGDSVGKALMAASVVCGIAGAVLLVASCLLYLLKYRKKHNKQNAAFSGNNDENDDNNKLQLVVRNP